MSTVAERWEWLERRGVALAVVVGLVARLALITALFRWDAAPITSDDATYVRFALSWMKAGRIETHHFPVGYPLFIAPFLTLGGAAFPAIRMVHVLFGLLTIVVTARITKLLYGPRAAVIAAFLVALYPPLVFMTGRIMSETLFIALLMLSMHRFVRSDRDESTRDAALAAVYLGVLSIIRSNLVAMVPFVPLWYLAKRGAALRGRVIRAAICTGLTVVLLMLPGLYFLTTTGKFVPFATNAGQTFYGANNPLAEGGWIEVNDHPELLATIPAEVRRDPAAFSKAQQALGVKWIRENPGAFLGLLPKKFANAWIPGAQTSETTSRSRLAGLVLPLASGLVLLGAILGRIMVRPACRDGMLLAILATYTVMSLAFYGNPRIGLFCAPTLIIYAAACMAWLLGRRDPGSTAGAMLP